MDYLLKNRPVSTIAEILDTVIQQPVDLDFTLPDYCADVEKILKCSVTPKIFSRTLSAGELRVDGASVIRILYTDSDRGRLRCCEQNLPFSATIPVSADVTDPMIFTSVKPEYLNCRALTPRRLAVHGAFSLHASISGREVCHIYEDNTDSDLQLHKQYADIMEVCSFAQESFSVAESAVLKSKGNIESIVRSDVSAVITDCIDTGDKVTIKGEITLSMLYICDVTTGDTDRFVYVFPFATALETGDRDCTAIDSRVDVLSFELLLKSELMSDEPVITADVKLCVSVTGYKPQSVTYLADAYSTKYATEPRYESLKLCSDAQPYSTQIVTRNNISLGDEQVSKIIDIFTEVPAVTASSDDSNLSIMGRVNVCILALNSDGKLICIERAVDFSKEDTLSHSISIVKNPEACVTSLSYRIGDSNTIELRLDVKLSAVLTDTLHLRQITDIVCLEDKPASANTCPLTLYYAHSGESVWDIAKHFSAPVDLLNEENSIDNDVVESSRMLLVLRV